MKIYEIGTGYTSVPPKISAATEVVVGELVNAFADMGESIQLFDIKSEDRPQGKCVVHEIKIPKSLSKTDVHLGIKHKIKRVVYSITLAFLLQKHIKKSKERIVLHFHNQYNLFFFLKCTSGKIREKVIIAYTNHSGIWSMKWDEVKETISKRYFQEAVSMKNADLVFALNDHMKNNICDHLHISAEKVHVIGNGVNGMTFRPINEAEIEAEKAKRKFSQKKILLQVGSVCENKGQLRVLNWIAPFLKADSDVVYAYAGGIVSREYQEQIRQFASEKELSDQVIYLGMLSSGDELNRIYNIADITITASVFEGFPLVTLESMASGTPVLINDVIPLDDESGCVRYTPETLIRLLKNLLSDDAQRKTLGQTARAYVLAHYSWANIAKQYLTEMKAL